MKGMNNMSIKKSIAVILSIATLNLPTVIKAEGETGYFDAVLNYASNLYIDDDITSDDLKNKGLESVLEDNPELLNKMLKSSFELLDEYSEFYTADEYKEYFTQLNNIYCGIGAMIQKQEDRIIVIKLFKNSGAQKAGVAEGDEIIAINGEPVKDRALSEVSQNCMGEKGSTVDVTIKRNGTETTYTVIRDEVEQDTVDKAVLKGDIGYMVISNFADSTANQFAEALDYFEKNNVKNIILDLRNNPGGLLDQALAIANYIVPEGVILQAIYRQEENNQIYYSSLKNPKFKFAVLVNENTASASEVLSSAMQESGVGYLIGTTTYGKGVIQNIYPLLTGDAIKITTGHYLTRNGNDINGVGIEPDMYVQNPKEPVDLSKYSKFDYYTKWSLGMSGEGVRAGKERLSILGYYSGEINDVYDKDMEYAVYKFQDAAEGLSPYGVMDISTQNWIQEEFRKVEFEIDSQMNTAYEYFGGKAEELEVKEEAND